MESIFVSNDWKRHLSINVDTGLWQCFKTGRSGNFVRFFAEVEEIPYFRAQRILTIRNFEYLGIERPVLEKEEAKLELDTSKLIPLSLSSGFSEDSREVEAWSFLFGRKLFREDCEGPEFYLCVEGKFADRVIIPFKNGFDVYYFQARALKNQNPKYLNPSIDQAPPPSHILYPYDENADHLVVCEGPLDAKSLQNQGVNATATMKNYISPQQTEILSTFEGKLIIGFDSDEAGMRGCEVFDTYRKQRRMSPFYVCSPPKPCKDWNEAHMKGANLLEWVTQESSLFDYNFKINAALSSL